MKSIKNKVAIVGMGCTKSSATEYPSAYVMIHAAGDPAGTMRTPVLAAPGTTYYRDSKATIYGLNWGCYSAAPNCFSYKAKPCHFFL